MMLGANAVNSFATDVTLRKPQRAMNVLAISHGETDQQVSSNRRKAIISHGIKLKFGA